jgi:hypothetical protein
VRSASQAGSKAGRGRVAIGESDQRPGHGGWRWHAGHWRHGYWHNGWWGPAVVAGVAVGALATYPYSSGYDYDNGCWAYEPVYDAYGNYLGQQYVNICY